MHYNWSKILSSDETVEKEFGISPLYLKFILIACIVLGIISCFVAYYGGIIIFFLGFLYWYYLKKAKHYALTKKRLIMVESFLSMSVISVDYAQMTDITVGQNVFDIIGKWGTLLINTAGTNSQQMVLSFIDQPHEIKKFIDSTRDTNVPKVQVVNPPAPTPPSTPTPPATP